MLASVNPHVFRRGAEEPLERNAEQDSFVWLLPPYFRATVSVPTLTRAEVLAARAPSSWVQLGAIAADETRHAAGDPGASTRAAGAARRRRSIRGRTGIRWARGRLRERRYFAAAPCGSSVVRLHDELPAAVGETRCVERATERRDHLGNRARSVVPRNGFGGRVRGRALNPVGEPGGSAGRPVLRTGVGRQSAVSGHRPVGAGVGVHAPSRPVVARPAGRRDCDDRAERSQERKGTVEDGGYPGQCRHMGSKDGRVGQRIQQESRQEQNAVSRGALEMMRVRE